MLTHKTYKVRRTICNARKHRVIRPYPIVHDMSSSPRVRRSYCVHEQYGIKASVRTPWSLL